MKIAILSNGNANYSTKRLVEEAEKRGHEVKVIKYKNCYLSLDEKQPDVFYRGKKLKKYDAIIHISLSSLMSSAYSNAVTIANEMDNVFVVDSRSLSTGIALLAIYASGLVEKGKSASEIFQKVKEKTEKVRASFVIDRLNYLHKGGRCSALSLLGANILKIKPQIVVENGKMVVAKKYRGSLKGTVEKYCDDLFVDYPNPHLEYVFITRSSEMNDIVESLKNKLRARGFRHIYDTMAGGTISSHCGPNCIGVLFMDKDEKDD